MTSMRRRYVASTSLRHHVPAGNLAPLGPPNILNLPTPMHLDTKNTYKDENQSFSFISRIVISTAAYSSQHTGFSKQIEGNDQKLIQSNPTLKEAHMHKFIKFKCSQKTCTVSQMNSSFPNRWSFSYNN